MEGDGYEAALVRERVARREAEALIVELQHQVRGLRHDVQSERAKFLNEQQLRDRDVDCLNDWIEHWQARAEVDEAQVEALTEALREIALIKPDLFVTLANAERALKAVGIAREALSRVSRSEPAPPNECPECHGRGEVWAGGPWARWFPCSRCAPPVPEEQP